MTIEGIKYLKNQKHLMNKRCLIVFYFQEIKISLKLVNNNSSNPLKVFKHKIYLN